MSEYVPGQCNIGSRERINRYIIGASGIVAAVLSVGITVQYSLPDYVLIFSFIPFFLGFEGVFQGLTSFCVHYAQKGVYEEEGELEQVADEDDHEKDFQKAMRIHLVSLVTAAVATLVVYIALA